MSDFSGEGPAQFKRDGVCYADIQEALSDRSRWSQEIALWEQMRTEGMRRRVMPYPNAADMHYPLIDDMISKRKPYFVEQAMGREMPASFVALDAQFSQFVVSVEKWFASKIFQETNFAEFVEIAADKMLQNGRVACRVIWNVARRRVEFEALDPVRCIVPAWTRDIADADWVVVVLEYSRAAYSRVAQFNQENSFVDSICGRGVDDQWLGFQRQIYEGVNGSSDRERIVVWEMYVQTQYGWRVHTFAPCRPQDDVRPPRPLPYTMGVFAERAGRMPPFFQLSAELRSEGWYSPRGLAKKLAPFQSSLAADWNAQKDWQMLTSSPMFAAPDAASKNISNMRFRPGEVVPFSIQPVTIPPPPFDLTQSMGMTRSTAEQLAGTPDFGMGKDPMTGSGGGSKTATEVQTISSVMGANIGMDGSRFARELTRGFQLSWGIYLQYAGEALDYFFRSEWQQLPPGALQDKYILRASASGRDTRVVRLQKAFQRRQMFAGDANINQRELVRSCLEEDDPFLLSRLLLDQDMQQADQAEDQAAEISIMLIGYPAMVKPGDNHAIHLQILAGYLQKRLSMGSAASSETLNSEFAANAAAHALAHFQLLEQQNPQVAQQFTQVMQEFQQMGQAAIAAQEQVTQQKQTLQ